VVEATGGIHASRETEFVERPMSGFGSELAEHAKRFVEKNHHNQSANTNQMQKYIILVTKK
jgi:hypothetical protein